jgi:hypothetical protein
VRRSGRLPRRRRLGRKATLRRTAGFERRTPLGRTPVSPASEEQRAKVNGLPCLVCGRRPVDPAHLVPRSLGGCDHPDCVVPLDRRCHRAFDGGQLDLPPHLEPDHRVELAHALSHLSLLELLRRVTGLRWAAGRERCRPAAPAGHDPDKGEDYDG